MTWDAEFARWEQAARLDADRFPLSRQIDRGFIVVPGGTMRAPLKLPKLAGWRGTIAGAGSSQSYVQPAGPLEYVGGGCHLRGVMLAALFEGDAAVVFRRDDENTSANDNLVSDVRIETFAHLPAPAQLLRVQSTEGITLAHVSAVQRRPGWAVTICAAGRAAGRYSPTMSGATILNLKAASYHREATALVLAGGVDRLTFLGGWLSAGKGAALGRHLEIRQCPLVSGAGWTLGGQPRRIAFVRTACEGPLACYDQTDGAAVADWGWLAQ